MMMVPSILFLEWSIIGIGTLLSILFVYIVIQRIYENRENAKIEKFIKQNSTSLYLYVMEGGELPRSCTSLTKWKRKAIEEMLSSYTNNFIGDTVQSQVYSYIEQYLQDHYRKQLKSLKWSNRLNVLYKIANFQLFFMVDDVLALLKNNKNYSSDELFQMYRLLAIFRHEEFLYYLLHPKKELGELDYKKLLDCLDSKQFESIIKQYDKLPLTLQKSVIEMVGSKHMSEFSFFLEQRLNEKIPEIRIRSLRAIGQIGLIRDISLYLPFATSIHWEERMMLAKLLGYVSFTISESYLYDLLKDSSWWVRHQAAQSILSHKNGVEMLETIINSTDDQFAIDMAKEVLERIN